MQDAAHWSGICALLKITVWATQCICEIFSDFNCNFFNQALIVITSGPDGSAVSTAASSSLGHYASQGNCTGCGAASGLDVRGM